ncbi:PREDICTED: gametogenetin-binding protein 2-like isoform X1 [Trachymyrmex septentrionalis]|uniref:gametogenetin-binding protein 2-like isoform X1 n=2 Tax=Trachymyrmex septentrionalis TaxID=34720 RepID=UPI00084EFDB5|nr:PREDICTED: gametogenetin-binding protein 2-like isoform X1 [Trachymyrmex septentrionalis]XP_018349698.1 PREDICTED: gametogenetin-binding protein 2-like isoform X1 [Trachymyrmex septentrionalis]
MARLINVWRDDEPVKLASKQMPLIVDENLTMIMDITGLGAICDNPLINGKQLDEFTKKFALLTMEEIKTSFAVTCKKIVEILSAAEPCVGCRRSVERLFTDLMKSGHPALDPLVITPDGVLSIKDDILKSPQQLCTLLHGHSTRLNNLMEKQQRNRKSQRCVLHTLEIQRLPPIWNSWREVWDCMELPCRQELTLIETDTLDEALDTYLRKHRFCAECRNKVLLASSLLTREPEPIKEKGYVAVLYSGIKRCYRDHHVHLPPITEYMTTLLGRAQPWALMGRERHAKTLEIAQEEVLTCLGICIADRLHKIHRRMKEEETVCKVLAAVAVDALSRNFQSAIEKKQGISQLELFYKQVAKEELAKQHKREKLRLKRKKKKGRRNEIEEKENSRDCSNERSQSDSPCTCVESKPTTQNINRHKLQVLDPKNKGPPTCKCPDCLKKPKTHSISQSQSKTELAFPVKKGSQKVKKITSETKKNLNTSQSKQNSTPCKQLSQEDSSDVCESCKEGEKIDENQWRYDDNCKDSMTNELVDAWITEPSENKYTTWMVMKKRFEMSERKNHTSSEQSSQDCGYSSEHNISSSSLPSTPEGSEVACNDEWCDHEGTCHDKFNHSNSSISLLQKKGPTLTQMLKDSCFSDDDEKESYIPVEEVLEFKSRVRQLTEKRRQLRQILRERFAMLCSHQKPLSILH